MATTGGPPTFWSAEGYRPTVDRIEAGAAACDELALMFEERASVEKHYAKELLAWSARWHERAEKIGEVGRGSALAAVILLIRPPFLGWHGLARHLAGSLAGGH